VDLYTDDQRRILSVKPGITDYASVEYFNENEILGKADDAQQTYIDVIMPTKIEMNMKYIANPGIIQDIKIMWATFKRIVSRN
jgi:lipopolysaccharide/colanic/teichoic acid biosynthesis glycosyltransferase